MTDNRDVLKRAKVMTIMYVVTCVIMAVSIALNFLMKFGVLPQSPTFAISFSLAIIMAVLLNAYSYYSRRKGGGYATSMPLKFTTLILMFAWVVSLAVFMFIQ